MLEPTFAISQLDPNAGIPEWIVGEDIVFTARTDTELSVFSRQEIVPKEIRFRGGWKCLRVEGPIAFDEVGTLLSLLEPLAVAKIGVLAISTFDTDYLFVRDLDLGITIEVLTGTGHTVISPC